MDDFNDISFDDYDFDVAPTTTPQPVSTQPSTPPVELEDPTTKIKKIKLDESLLIDSKGIPLLRNESRHLKFKGKNHEAEDLKKLMTYYTVWANNLYPKLKFDDFAKRVGQHASGRLVKNMLTEWQDEYKEKLKVRRYAQSELSGKTVGDDDDDGRVEEEAEESSDDDNRPLFIPFSSDTPAKEKPKKVQKPKPVKKRYTEDVSQKPRTITFSDDEEEEEEEETNKYSVKSGREYALAILAEKRKKRKLAQQKAQQQEEEEEEELMIEKNKIPEKSVDDIMNEYYEDSIELALSDNELSSLNIPSNNNQEKSTTEKDTEMHDI